MLYNCILSGFAFCIQPGIFKSMVSIRIAIPVLAEKCVLLQLCTDIKKQTVYDKVAVVYDFDVSSKSITCVLSVC